MGVIFFYVCRYLGKYLLIEGSILVGLVKEEIVHEGVGFAREGLRGAPLRIGGEIHSAHEHST